MDEDREAALEWIDYEATLCSGCGRPKVECMDPVNDGAYEAVPMRCFACQARDKQSAKWARDDKSDTAGLMLGIVDSDDVKRG